MTLLRLAAFEDQIFILLIFFLQARRHDNF